MFSGLLSLAPLWFLELLQQSPVQLVATSPVMSRVSAVSAGVALSISLVLGGAAAVQTSVAFGRFAATPRTVLLHPPLVSLLLLALFPAIHGTQTLSGLVPELRATLLIVGSSVIVSLVSPAVSKAVEQMGMTLVALGVALAWSVLVLWRFGASDVWQSWALVACSAGGLVAWLVDIGSRRALAWALGLTVLVPGLLTASWGGRALPPPEEVAPPSARSPHVVVVVVDTLRTDEADREVDGERVMPYLGTLADGRATRFRHAYSAASATAPSVAALFTGQPATHWGGDPTAPPPLDAWTLARALHRFGYRTGAFSANGVIGGNGFRTGFQEYWCVSGFGFYQQTFFPYRLLGGSDPWNAMRRAADFGLYEESGWTVRKRARDWIAEDSSRPAFLYVHLIEPHWPYYDRSQGFRSAELSSIPDPLAFWELLRLPAGSRANAALVGSRRLEELLARYREELRWADRIIEMLVEDLRELGILDSTLLLIAGDHGEEFFEHLGFSHGHHVFEEQVRVPLLIHWPREPRFQEMPKEVSDPVSLLDVLPTLTDLLELEAPPTPLRGRSLVPLLQGETASPGVLAQSFYGRSFRTSYREGNRKVLLENSGAMAPLAARSLGAFDLEEDPGEREPLDPTDPATQALVERARHAAQKSWLARRRVDAPAMQSQERDDQTLEQLKRLGYVE